MKTVEITKAKLPLANYTKDVIKEPVIVTIRGKPVAALVSIENADIETASLSNNPQFLALIERSRIRQKEKGGISTKEMRHRLQKAKHS
ncbi:MAG: hypothetical protein COS84_02095 [Armatimonadetes bacterium CG07_land_8_20_14_0_80_40_9]|nr:MAG: hypothetical protein COS84_02095 [Armatimonadetes bacterium CG07_land_8_20_14_0_80_40_9]